MKKLLSIISAITMCVVISTPMISSATDGDESKNPSESIEYTEANSSELTCKAIIDGSYIVVIPTGTADISKNAVDLEVSASDVIIGGNQTLNVSVKSENGWELHNEYNEVLTYTLTPIDEDGNKGTALTEQESVILSISGNRNADKEPVTEEGESKEQETEIEPPESEEPTESAVEKVKLRAEIDGHATMAGEYTDKLTFTVSVVTTADENQETTKEGVDNKDNPQPQNDEHKEEEE